jgi:hypothetical protein
VRYMLLIYNNDVTTEDFEGAGRPAFDAAHAAVSEELAAAGELIASDALEQPTAKVVRTPGGGAPAVERGPYRGAPEFVGGFYLIDVADEARALAIAARLREADTSLIEVRRLEFSQAP